MSVQPLYSLTSITDLYNYEEPVLFLSKVGFLQAIFLKIGQDEEVGLFLSCYIDEPHVDALLDGRVSIRGVFEAQKNIFLVHIDEDLNVISEQPSSIDEILESRLPRANVGLLPRFGVCPDVIEEKDSLLTVYFNGGVLRRDSIPYSTLMELLSAVRSMAKNVIVPPQLRGLKSSTFDFLVGDPALGSLMISIKKPTVSLGALRKNEERKNITFQDVYAGVSYSKDMFFENVEELFSEDHKKAEEDTELYSNIRSILPGDESAFSNVTLSTNVNGQTKRISIDKRSADRIRDRYEERAGVNVVRAGTIIEINAASQTILLKSFLNVITTCYFPKENYDIVAPDANFKIGSSMVLQGDVTERPRRDYMVVARVVQLLPKRD